MAGQLLAKLFPNIKITSVGIMHAKAKVEMGVQTKGLFHRRKTHQRWKQLRNSGTQFSEIIWV